jgi:oxygen-independent coproporphyrinogen-3 oxidase
LAGIYIHIPFCKQACFYCDFHFSTSLKKKASLLSCIEKEIQLKKEIFKNKIVETIYFGGGTPSLLSAVEINSLIETVYKNYNIVRNPEITLEANPDDLYEEKIIELAASKINRLSIGIQSFFDDDLVLMNRAHNAEEAKKSLQIAVKYFKNISIDLIYGIPNASNKKWKQNIDMALSFGVPHISSYALTVEEKTPLKSLIEKGKIANTNDEVSAAQFTILVDKLAEEGFVHYELSNFGKEGFFSKNNSAYWLGKWYLGFGPSAHSFYKNQRAWNVNSNSKYIKSILENTIPEEVEVLSKVDRFNEIIMTGLRTIWGIDLEKIKQLFGKQYELYLRQKIARFLDEELVCIESNVVKTTNKGKFLADGIASDLFMLENE